MMNSRRSIPVSLLVILGAAVGVIMFLLPSVAAAQPPEDVRGEIEKTDRILDLARKIVTELDAVHADEALGGATNLQKDARDALDLGEPQRALRLTHEARRRAQDAMGGDVRGPDDSRTVERELQKTDRMLEGAGEWEGKRGGPHAHRRLSDLRLQQEQAWGFHRDHRLRHAIRKTLGVREALQGFRPPGDEGPGFPPGPPDRLEQETSRMGKAIERLRAMVNGDNPRAREQLELAEAAHGAAVGALRDGDERRARMHLQEGRHALGAVFQDVADDLREKDFSNLIDDARRRLDDIAGEVGDDPAPEIEHLLRAAEGSLVKAQEAYDANLRRRALLNMHRALNILDQVEAESVP